MMPLLKAKELVRAPRNVAGVIKIKNQRRGRLVMALNGT
jgi:hypothetical protein